MTSCVWTASRGATAHSEAPPRPPQRAAAAPSGQPITQYGRTRANRYCVDEYPIFQNVW